MHKPNITRPHSLLSTKHSLAIIHEHPCKLRQQHKRVHQIIRLRSRYFIILLLGIYSLSILPHFAHTSNLAHRQKILKMLNDYYLDLGLQLIPMLMGLIKCILPVYNTVTDHGFLEDI